MCGLVHTRGRQRVNVAGVKSCDEKIASGIKWERRHCGIDLLWRVSKAMPQIFRFLDMCMFLRTKK